MAKNIFPFVNDLAGYTKDNFRCDLIAGLTVGIILVPQAMAYAYLAGMPPVYGLYAGLVPLILFALFTSSRHLSVGPVAISSLLVLAGISNVATPGSEEYIQLVISAGLMIGLFQMLMSFFRMGFLANFLSRPVLAGFTSAAAVIIIINQLKDVLGFQGGMANHPLKTLENALGNLSQTNFQALAISIGSIIIILVCKKIHRKIPGALLVFIMATAICYYLNSIGKLSLDVIGSVPSGLPAFELPIINEEIFYKILPTVFTVTLISIVESLGVAKALESKHNYYTVEPDRELFALGISKSIGSLFQAMPSSGSFSRSAINSDSGGRTSISSFITGALVIITLLFLMSIFYYLPKAALAGIIISAVLGLFNYKEAIHLWKTHKQDFYMMIATFLCTIAFGIEQGVLIGVMLSIMTVLYRSARPHVAVLGKVPGTNYYRNIERFEIVDHAADTLIVRFDDQLYFANAAYFKESILSLISESPSKIEFLYLDAKGINDIDSSGTHALRELFEELEKMGIQLNICGAIGPVRDQLRKSGLMDKIGKDHQFMHLHEAMEARV